MRELGITPGGAKDRVERVHVLDVETDFLVLADGLDRHQGINGDGLLAGNPHQLAIEALAAVVVWTYASVMTYVCLKLVNVFIPLRVSESEEAMGLDMSQHAEAAYRL